MPRLDETFSPTEARSALAALLAATVANHREVDLDAAIALALKAEPAPTPTLQTEPEPAPAPKRRQTKRECVPATNELRGRPSKRAQALVRAQLTHGPRPGSSVMAAAEGAEISERTLIAAADAPGGPRPQRPMVAAGSNRRNRAGPRPAQI